MNHTPCKAGSALLLALALAPGLHAGSKPSRPGAAPAARGGSQVSLSRTALALAGAGWLAAATAAEPAAAASLAQAAPAGAPLPAEVRSGSMSYYCGNPIMEPHPERDPAIVDLLAMEALEGYKAGGLDPEIASKEPCMEPFPWDWKAPSKPTSAKEATQRQVFGERLPAMDVDGNQGEVEGWARLLDQYVFKGLVDYAGSGAEDRQRALYNRLLEAASLKVRLERTEKRAQVLHKQAQVRRTVAEQAMAPDPAAWQARKKEAIQQKRLSQKKEELAVRAGRLPQAQQARKETARAEATLKGLDEAGQSLEQARYEAARTGNNLARCKEVMDRFRNHIDPLLTALGPGTATTPVWAAETQMEAPGGGD